MKDTVKKMQSFVIFELPLHRDYIAKQFSIIQQEFQNAEPGWSTNGTRQKLIARYWFTYVPGHFALLLGIPFLLTILLSQNFQINYFTGLFLAGGFSFIVMYLFQYRPCFCNTFLPQLETVKEAFEQKNLEQIEKCRKAQLSNPALCLIYYVFDQVTEMKALQPNDQFAGVLMKLYGVDRGSIKNNLELLFGSGAKRRNLTDRKRTEIQNRFAEAYKFFEELNYPQGSNLLEKLETKLLPTE